MALCCRYASAQHEQANQLPLDYQFTELSARHGLPTSEILTLCIDHRQQLWIGHTAGLSRYDGYNVYNYLYSHNKRIGRVYCLLEDTARNILWIGAAGGLFYYDGTEVKAVKLRDQTLPVYSLLQQNFQLWVGTGMGPALLDSQRIAQIMKADTISLITEIIPAWRSLKHDQRAKQLALHTNGNLLVGNASRVYEVEPGVMKEIWRSTHPSDLLNGISCTGKGEVMICGNFSGVNYKENNTWKTLPISFITGMDFHQEQGNWYYYNAEAIFQVDIEKKTFKLIVSIPFDHREWGSAFTCDKDGNFWIATHEGLLYAKPAIFKSHLQDEPEGFNELYSLCLLKDGTIIAGGNRGRLFKRSGDRFEMATPKDKRIFPQAEIKSICQTADGEIWYGSGYQGLARQTPKGLQYYYQQGVDKTFLHAQQLSNGELWTTGDKNITRIHKYSKDSLVFTQYSWRQNITDNPQIRSIVESPNGRVYVGSSWALATVRDGALEQVPLHKEQSFAINDMQKDQAGKVWIATQGKGLLHCSFAGDSLVVEKQLTVNEGLSSDIFVKILVDKDNMLWALAYNGLNRIEERNGEYHIASREIDRQLLKGDYQNADMLQDNQGTIWMATSSGLLSFNPAVYTQTLSAPTLFLSSIKLMGNGRTRNLLPYQHEFLPATLSHKENTLEIQFTGINYSNPAAVQYEYRLREQDTAWIKLHNNRQLLLSSMPAGSYTLQVRANAGSDQWSKTISWRFTILAPFWRTTWFVILVFIIAALISFLVIRIRMKNLRNKAAIQRDFERQIARVKMNMLRAQMNPHFIFNSLNSINNFILKNDPQNASGYLTKFSRLMRMILDNSRNEWVTLENELNALDLYIQLEAIRFDNVFRYKLHIDKTINPAQVVIPPLIIQPYVENAIWHGLLYRETPGGILNLEIKRVGDTLEIIVEDNGVGREASAAMHSRSALKRKSHGMKITGERLDIVNMTYNANTSVAVSDLHDEINSATGTRVQITLNYIQNKMA